MGQRIMYEDGGRWNIVFYKALVGYLTFTFVTLDSTDYYTADHNGNSFVFFCSFL